MVDVYIPPLRTNSGMRFGYYIQKSEEEIEAEKAREKEKRRLERLYVIPRKLTPDERKQRRRDYESSPEYKAMRRMKYRKRREDPEIIKRDRERARAYRERKQAEKALKAAGDTE